jgi:hypothetical protein
MTGVSRLATTNPFVFCATAVAVPVLRDVGVAASWDTICLRGVLSVCISRQRGQSVRGITR